MRIDTTIDRTIVGTKEFCNKFLCRSSDIASWRAQGMPYIKTDVIFEYNVADCQAWFAGKYSSSSPVKIEKPFKVGNTNKPCIIEGYVVQTEAAGILRISGKILKEARLAGMPHKQVGKAFMYNISACVKWLEQSEQFKHRIKWRMKRGDDNAGE